MNSSGTSGKPLVTATVAGTVLQLAMILTGHWVEAVRLHGFAIGGMVISAIAGILYARLARADRGLSALNGALAGGACALVGIAASVMLGDTAALILVVGTASSAIAGAIGGAIAGGRR
jgi:hypothetical protein